MLLIGFQGDCCFFSVDKIPEELYQDQQTKDGILAYGEGSGHCHAVHNLDDVEVYKDPNSNLIYLNVIRRTAVTHGRIKGFTGKETDTDYHSSVYLDPGKYVTGIVEETDWLTRTIRRVVD